MNRCAVIFQLPEEHSDLEYVIFLKLARSFVFEVKRKLKDDRLDVVTVSYRKWHFQGYGIIRMRVIRVDENLKKSMRVIARELQFDEATIRCVIQEDFRWRS